MEEEFGISLGSYLNVLGELKWNKELNLFYIENPLYLCLSK